jgi:diguanylate cyclase (GGDEF)-like protein
VGRTLTRKFVLLLSGFLALQVLQLGLGIYQVWEVSEEAELLSGAGKIRPLALAEIGRRALTPGDAQAQTWRAFRERLALHDGIYRRLREKYEPRKVDEHYGRLAGFAREASETWERELRPLLLAVNPDHPQAATAALARFEVLAPAQVERIARLVELFEQEVALKTRRAMRNHALIFALSISLAFLMVWFVRRHVTHPLQRFIETSQAIADGAYDRHVRISSKDELGDLAETFNRMAEAVSGKTARITAFNRAAGFITSSLSVREILDQIMYHGIDVSGAKAACLAFYDEQTGRFNDWVAHGLSDHFVQNMSFRPGGLADETFISGTYVLSNDLPGTRHQLSKLARDEGIRSFLCLPLTSHTGRLGVIYFYRSDRDTFLPDEIDLLKTFAHLAAGGLENARLYARVEQEARIDTLTGLLNRRVFDRRLDNEQRRAQRYGKPYTLLMIDIDHFKRVNDNYGHPAGDAVLQALAGILKKQFRDVDTVARYGGEEFVVILPEISDGTAKPVAERVCRAVAATPFRLPDGREIGITVSIGVSCYPHCGANAREVVERADQALYTAKEAGRSRVVLYREMLKKRIDADPGCIVVLLNESLDNIQPIVTAISAKTPFFRGHMQAVEQAALKLARTLRLSVDDTEALKLASRLHDLGMAVIPDAILDKTAKLTSEEWEQVRRHPAIAADWLEQVPALKHLAPIVRHHHERWDGGGYPDGLKGEATPYLARVLAVADAYGSMITDWPGHKAMRAEEVKSALRADARTQFDPAIAQAWLRTLEETPVQV